VRPYSAPQFLPTGCVNHLLELPHWVTIGSYFCHFSSCDWLRGLVHCADMHVTFAKNLSLSRLIALTCALPRTRNLEALRSGATATALYTVQYLSHRVHALVTFLTSRPLSQLLAPPDLVRRGPVVESQMRQSRMYVTDSDRCCIQRQNLSSRRPLLLLLLLLLLLMLLLMLLMLLLHPRP
jgi:hypothetical protein